MQIQLHVLVEALDLESFVIKEDFEVLDSAAHVIDIFPQEASHILVNALHSEVLKVQLEGDLSPFLALAVARNLRLPPDTKFAVLLFTLLVSRLNRELERVDVD